MSAINVTPAEADLILVALRSQASQQLTGFGEVSADLQTLMAKLMPEAVVEAPVVEPIVEEVVKKSTKKVVEEIPAEETPTEDK